jgi:hypothetical protein
MTHAGSSRIWRVLCIRYGLEYTRPALTCCYLAAVLMHGVFDGAGHTV